MGIKIHKTGVRRCYDGADPDSNRFGRVDTALMAISAPNSTATTATAPGTGQSYGAPLAVVTTLFFMWGFLTCLNDILVPHLKSIFDLSYAGIMLIQFAFFGAYFIFSLPSARIVDWIGYQRSMVAGLLTMGLGAFLFVPAASAPSYPLFLAALVVLAAGITCLQVAANPYVTVLGKPATASSRLNLTQAFNSLGTFLAPFFGGLLILSAAPKAMDEIRAMAPDALQAYRLHEAATVKTPYIGLGITLVLLAIAIGSFRLPKIEHAQHKVGEKVNDSIWKHPNLPFGAIAIFVYVGAEVAIGSSIANYLALPNIGHFASGVADPAARYHSALAVAARYISIYWLGAMVGRFIGSAVLQKVKTSRVLAFCATMSALLVVVTVLSNGHFAMWSVLSIGLFNSIMFPSIFTRGIAELGPLTGDGSGLLNMAIVGGAIIPWVVGRVGDAINHSWYPSMIQGETSWGQGIHFALILAAFCYLYILFYAVSGSKP